MRRGVSLEAVYPHPPERIWKALTDRKALGKWLLPTDFRPEMGNRFRFVRSDPRRGKQSVECEVVEIEAPRRLSYTWRAESEENLSLVTFTLEPVEAGTRLRLEHSPLDEFAKTPCTASLGRNWESVLLSRLPRVLRRMGTARRRVVGRIFCQR